MIESICAFCKKTVMKQSCDTKDRNGRPWLNAFCNRACHDGWQRQQNNECKRNKQHFQRSVWGTTPLRRFDAKYARQYGKVGEAKARDIILPALGFKDIVDLSGYSNQFFIDFVATKDGQKVLVDATIKMSAHIPEKTWLASALGMRLFIVHVSPTSDLFWVNEVRPGTTTSKVPAEFMRKKAEESGIELGSSSYRELCARRSEQARCRHEGNREPQGRGNDHPGRRQEAGPRQEPSAAQPLSDGA